MRVSQSEYLAMQGRCDQARGKCDVRIDGPKLQQRERELHEYVVDVCRRKTWLPFHGSMAHRTFRTPGEPDFVILCDHGRLLIVECKTNDGKLSPHQIGIKAWCEQLGHTYHVVRSKQDFDRLIESLQPSQPQHHID